MRVVLLDTETTGVPDFKLPADDPSQPRMCSLAAMLVEDGQLVESFYHLVYPGDWTNQDRAKAIKRSNPDGPSAFDINGLSIERLKAEGRPAEVVLDLYDALVNRAELIAAFGIHFDQKIVRGEQRRLGRDDRYGWLPTFCVQQAATKICGIPPTAKKAASGRLWNKTPNLGEALRILLDQPHDDAHDAMGDLEATLRIFEYMRVRGLVQPKPQISRRVDKR